MPEKDLLINLSIIKEVIEKVAFGKRQKLPFFAIEKQESQLESRYGSKRYSHPFLDRSEESFVLTRQKTSFSVSDTLRAKRTISFNIRQLTKLGRMVWEMHNNQWM